MSPAEPRDVRILAVFLALVVATGVALVAATRIDRYPGAPAARGSLVLEGGTVFDGTGAAARAARVVVTGDRIACVGDGCPVPDAARVIDATGLAVLPGLVDLKAHFASADPDDAGRALPLRMWDYARQRPRVRRALHRAGVTTIRELGNVKDTALALKHDVAAGRLSGPRVFAAGPVFTAPSGIPVATEFAGNVYLIEAVTRQVSDAERARAAVQRLAADGVDGIAAVVDGGIVDDLPRLEPAVLRAAATEAHRNGLWVAVSTGRGRDVRDALSAGADTIQFGAIFDGPLDAETLSLMRDRDVTFVPVLADVERFLVWASSADRPATFPPAAWSALREAIGHAGVAGVMEPMLASVQRAAAAGVRIGTGTSTASFGTSLHRELELLVQSGLAPGAALVAATRDAARALRAERDFGTVETGKRADLVVVGGRPWERIADVRDVRLVIQAGRVVVDGAR